MDKCQIEDELLPGKCCPSRIAYTVAFFTPLQNDKKRQKKTKKTLALNSHLLVLNDFLHSFFWELPLCLCGATEILCRLIRKNVTDTVALSIMDTCCESRL